jgi:hypothetical protein
MVTSASALVSDQSDGDTSAPDISYQPGANPDIISLSLGDNRFKESLLPEPKVIRAEELVDTRFDVITYSQTGEDAYFLRREEFAAVSCECTLRAPDTDNTGHRPVIWAGDEYARGQHAVKAYGESASNQQSPLCDACCRDHHDGGTVVTGQVADHSDTGVNTYVPFKPAAERAGAYGDHKHYTRPRNGPPVEVTTAGSTYVEACRLVRVDGFFRVAQDFRREDMHIFPADFLDNDNEIDVYSDFVTGAASLYAAAVSDGYESNPPCIGPSPCVVPPAPKQGAYDAALNLESGEFPSWTTLPFRESLAVISDTQQLRSRGVYIDFLSDDLRSVLTCLAATVDADSDSCTSGDIELDRTGSINPLELIPFFDVQLTKLTRWNENPLNIPVDTTNEALEDQNTHSRGLISESADGVSTVSAQSEPGNIGFTDTLPIDPLYATTNTSIEVHAGVDTPPLPTDVREISGHLNELLPGFPDIIITGLNGAQCGQTSEAYWCVIPDDASNPRIEISGYGKSNTYRYACSINSLLAADAVNTVTNGENAKAVFNIGDASSGTDYDFVIQGVRCPIAPPESS